MSPAIKKWVVRPFLILLTAIVILFGIGFLVLTTQQQRLVNVALAELNKQFKGELTIDKSSISVLRNFPHVSVALHDVKFYGDKDKTGQPIYALEKLYVGFSIPGLFQNKYDVRRLLLTNGYINMVRERQGTVNLLEAKNLYRDTARDSTPDTSSVEAQVNLEKIVLQQIDVSFTDHTSGARYHSYIENLASSFKMDSLGLAGATNGEMKIDITTEADTTLFRHKQVVLELAGSYRTRDHHLDLTLCNVKLEEAGFIINGSANLKGDPDLDLKIKGDKQDFKLISAFIPQHVKQNIKPFQYDGRLYFDASIKGIIGKNEMPLVQVNFGCEDAWVHNTGADKKVDQLGFRGFYTNGERRSLETSEVHMINVHARPEKGVFQGNFVVRDFTKPKTLIQIKSELELQFLGEFLGIHDLKQITGTIKLDMNFRELTDIKLPEESLNKLKEGIQSKLIVRDLAFKIPDYPHSVRNMNLQAEMENGKITVDSAFLRIGNSDLHVDGSLSDIRAFLRHHEKPIKLTLNARSSKLLLSELFSYDTALARQFNGEQVSGFNIGFVLETSVQQLLNPAPLPKGTLEMKNLNAVFKAYPHTFKNLNAVVMINDTTLRLRNLVGVIDSSDFQFSGRVNNYVLWFNDIKKGKTQIAFDFKSNRFAFQDVFGRSIRQYLPRGYRREMLKNAWLRTKIDLRYDTTFRFAKAKIANVSGELVKHKLKLTNISGHVKYGRRLLVLDTMRGSIGRSDFDFTLKYFNGPDRNMQKRTNYLKFTSKFLDADEISQYDLAPKTGPRRMPGDTTAAVAVATVDSTKHKDAFNIFVIPFSDFNAEVDIAKIKYNRLWLKDVSARVRMQEDHNIFIDTLQMKVADGALSLNGQFDGSNPKKIFFRSNINVQQLDLEKTMLKLDHFGQDIVINKNIKGKLSGQIKSYVQIHPNLVPIMKKARADVKVTICNGSLVDFAPMKAMSGFFKDKNLRLIRFDTLRNRLSFANGVLSIPAMDINSSLGYIQMSGKQSVDLSMEYYVRVPLKMVTKAGLGSLFKQRPEEVDLTKVDEIEYVDKNTAFMNLKVVGKPADFQVALGKDKSRRGKLK